MALFGRKDKTGIPAEIEEYYQTERRERAGVAWLLAFGTLVVTVVLATGIFFAGRWAYRTVFNGEDKPAEVAQTEEQEAQPEEEPAATTETDEELEAEEERQAEENRQREEADRQAEQEAASQNEEADREEQAETEQQEETSENVAGTSNIPDTGPGDVAAIFAGTSALGYLVHRVFSKRRNYN